MSSCGTEPYRPRRSFSSPIISSLHVQPLSLTSRNAKSPGWGVTTCPGVPHAAVSIRSARESRFIVRSLKAKSKGCKRGDLVLELDAAHVFEERQLDRQLEVHRRPGPKRPVD